MGDSTRFILRDTNVAFCVIGGPLDDTSPSPFFADLGDAFSAWAHMEYMLTCLVLHMNKASASPALYASNPQTQFSTLLKLLRKWITKHPGYAGITSDPKFFDYLLELAKFRNELGTSPPKKPRAKPSCSMRVCGLDLGKRPPERGQIWQAFGG